MCFFFLLIAHLWLCLDVREIRRERKWIKRNEKRRKIENMMFYFVVFGWEENGKERKQNKTFFYSLNWIKKSEKKEKLIQ